MATAYINGRVYTMKEEGDRISAFVVHDGRFLYCGTNHFAEQTNFCEQIEQAEQWTFRNKRDKRNNDICGTSGTIISLWNKHFTIFSPLTFIFWDRKYIQLWLVYIILYILAAAQLRLLSSGVFLCFAPLHFLHSHQRRRSVFS